MPSSARAVASYSMTAVDAARAMRVINMLAVHDETGHAPHQISSSYAERKDNKRHIPRAESDDSREQTARHTPAGRERTVVAGLTINP